MSILVYYTAYSLVTKTCTWYNRKYYGLPFITTYRTNLSFLFFIYRFLSTSSQDTNSLSHFFLYTWKTFRQFASKFDPEKFFLRLPLMTKANRQIFFGTIWLLLTISIQSPEPFHASVSVHFYSITCLIIVLLPYCCSLCFYRFISANIVLISCFCLPLNQ